MTDAPGSRAAGRRRKNRAGHANWRAPPGLAYVDAYIADAARALGEPPA